MGIDEFLGESSPWNKYLLITFSVFALLEESLVIYWCVDLAMLLRKHTIELKKMNLFAFFFSFSFFINNLLLLSRYYGDCPGYRSYPPNLDGYYQEDYEVGSTYTLLFCE